MKKIPVTHRCGSFRCLKTAFYIPETYIEGQVLRAEDITYADGSPHLEGDFVRCSSCGANVSVALEVSNAVRENNCIEL